MSKWDEKYSIEEYVCGREPNEFLVQVRLHIPKGRVLCIGEGEGRNAVFFAEQGDEATAVDLGRAGCKKHERLAAERGVRITTITAELADFVIEPGTWEGIVSIFCRLEPTLRRRVHRACAAGLAPRGMMILEAFSPEQRRYGTGGLKSLELLMTLADLQKEFAELEIRIAGEMVCRRVKGIGHSGDAAVVQLLAAKPSGAISPDQPEQMKKQRQQYL